MRSLASIASVALSVVAITIASLGPAAAVEIVRVPEPMTALVLGCGLVGAAVIRRRKKK
jgi:hypothetical protein